VIITYRYRVKDGSASTRRALRAQARAVNFVWNYCCNIDRQADERWRAGMYARRPTTFDLIRLCRGVTRDLGIHSDTVDAICARFVAAREAHFPKTPRFRSIKRSLDWIPFSNFARPAKLENGVLTLLKRRYFLWFSRPFPDAGKPKTWAFSTDARGRWYVNIQIEITEPDRRDGIAVGIDLGLKTFATLSSGETIDTPAFYRRSEEQLAKLHRYGMTSRARSLNAKVANQRKDFLHKITTMLVNKYSTIVVGNVNSSGLTKTRMAKSVNDASWAEFKLMLKYKSIATGATFKLVDERFTSQTCSCCGTVPDSSPKGKGALGIRQWSCSECGASHDRDVNAARNILRVGAERRPPAVGIPIRGKTLSPGHSTKPDRDQAIRPCNSP
jgi:putative transposase